MLISLEWLREYVTVDMPADELARRLTEAGLAVEGVTPVGSDFVLNVEVTSNRPDCLGHIGVAREVSALTGAPLKLPDVSLVETDEFAERAVSIRVDDANLCPQYAARVLRDARVKPSPAFMVRRLEAVGLRSVSNIVDITNYVLMETGQPLHAFDFDKLHGGRIIVRRARAGETMNAINGKALAFDPKALGSELPLVIADADRPVAVAGIMGGAETEVGPFTRNLLLESAEFDMLAIRRGSRSLLLDSDSSFRFERGIDSAGVEWASKRAAKLLVELADAKLCQGVVTVAAPQPAPVEVTLRFARIQALLGFAVPADEAVSILRRLSFEILAGDAATVRVRVPSHRRRDVSREVDLIEEVARIRGYAAIPDNAPMPVRVAARSPRTVFEDRVTQALTASGYWEIIGKSLVDPALADTAPGAATLGVDRSRTKFHALRRSLIPGLLTVRARNRNVGVERASLYEIANVYLPRPGVELPDEPTRLGMVSDGDTDDDWRKFLGAVRAVAAACGLADALTVAAAAIPGTDVGVELKLDGKPLGWAGHIDRKRSAEFDLRRGINAAELELDLLCTLGRTSGRFHGLPRYPSVVRDLNVVVGEAVLWRQIEQSVRGAGIRELESLEYKSTWTKGIGEGKKSLTFSMTFRSPDETLTGEQAVAFSQAVLAKLTADLGAVLRT